MTSLDERKRHIYKVLSDNHGDKLRAAVDLDIPVKALMNLINSEPFFAAFRSDPAKVFVPHPLPLSQPPPVIEVPDDEVVSKREVYAPRVPKTFNPSDVIATLHSLMKSVTLTTCTPATVNAACACAEQITRIMEKMKGL